MKNLLYLLILTFLLSCGSCIDSSQKENKSSGKSGNLYKIYTKYSTLKNQYTNFNSPKAINKIAEIENEYFNNFRDSVSKYYGTEWGISAKYRFRINDTISVFDSYIKELSQNGIKPDSMHCTIYAVEALKAGMDTTFPKLNQYHREIWKDREYAGWSIGYILTKYFNWKAYLFISEYSSEYERCVNNFKKYKKYYVWKQPDIPLENMYDFDNEKETIDSLLLENEFGWGFSDQGFHTWITRFDTLKECNWIGTPSYKYDDSGVELFIKTKFTEFYDYGSHVIIFPP